MTGPFPEGSWTSWFPQDGHPDTWRRWAAMDAHGREVMEHGERAYRMEQEEKDARALRFQHREALEAYRAALNHLEEAQRMVDAARYRLAPEHPCYGQLRAIWEQIMDTSAELARAGVAVRGDERG